MKTRPPARSEHLSFAVAYAPTTTIWPSQEVPHAVTFCAAAILGDMTGSLWLVPSEVVKVQMQVSKVAFACRMFMYL